MTRRTVIICPVLFGVLAGCASGSYGGCPTVSHNLDGVDLTSATDAVVIGRVESAERDPQFAVYAVRLIRILKNSSAPLPSVFEVERRTEYFERTNDPVGTPVYLVPETVSIMALKVIPRSGESSSDGYELLYGTACDNFLSERS
jgi:hypothetical protein